MKHFYLIILFCSIIFSGANAQNTYISGQGELIFSLSNIDVPGMNVDRKLRFTAFPNVELVYNVDFSNAVGLYAGISFNNIGLTFEDSVKHKYRNLAFGIPLALKFGNFENNSFFFLGGQYEYYFHYKEKHFLPGGKVKNSEFLSDKVNAIQPSAFVGFAFLNMMVRFKYYFDNFFNTGYTFEESGQTFQPFAGVTSNIFYVSLTFRDDLNFD